MASLIRMPTSACGPVGWANRSACRLSAAPTAGRLLEALGRVAGAVEQAEAVQLGGHDLGPGDPERDGGDAGSDRGEHPTPEVVRRGHAALVEVRAHRAALELGGPHRACRAGCTSGCSRTAARSHATSPPPAQQAGRAVGPERAGRRPSGRTAPRRDRSTSRGNPGSAHRSNPRLSRCRARPCGRTPAAATDQPRGWPAARSVSTRAMRTLSR